MSKETDNDAKTNKPIPLKHPYKTAAGAPINQVQVSGITVKQMKLAQRRGGTDEAETETAMVAAACDLVMEDLEDMHMIDYTKVRARFQSLNFDSSDESVAEPTGSAG